MSEETVTFNLELNVGEALGEARKFELVLSRIFGLLARLGLPADLTAAIRKIQQVIMTIRMLHTAIIALNTALIAVSGGSFAILQFAMAGIGFAGVGLSFTDILSGY